MTPIKVPASGVQVWRAGLDQPRAGLDVLVQSLSPDERARAARFHWPGDAARFVAARGLLRGLLGDALGRSPASLHFHYNACGKPSLAGDGAALCFNLSHCDGVALFALAWGREVGIDIERVHAGTDHVSLAERYLPAGAASPLPSLPPADRPAAFTRAWVRQEAYLKALGAGFSAAVVPMRGGEWGCHDLEVGAEYRAALVVKSHRP